MAVKLHEGGNVFHPAKILFNELLNIHLFIAATSGTSWVNVWQPMTLVDDYSMKKYEFRASP